MVAILALLALAALGRAALPHPAACPGPQDCPEGQTLIDGECVPDACVFPNFQTGEPSVCGGGGVCQYDKFSDRYVCGCELGFLSNDEYGCLPTYCAITEGVICQFGKCTKNEIGFYRCECDEGYLMYMDHCVSEQCLAVPGLPVSLCSGQGECVHDNATDTWTCECDVWHTGSTCKECSERAFLYNGVCEDLACRVVIEDGTVTLCNDLGICYHPYNSDESHCLCYEESINPENDCIFAGCYNWPEADTLCSNHGICTGYGCRCEEGYDGPICEYSDVPACAENETLLDYSRCVLTSCVFGVFESINVPSECSGHGTCGADGVCVCDEDFVLGGKLGCVPAGCYDQESGELCHQGQCDLDPRDDTYKCYCNEGFVMVDGRCVRAACYFPSFDDPSVLVECAGFGHCTLEDDAYVCKCEAHTIFVKGAGCVPEHCLVHSEVCPHGRCEDYDGGFQCRCDEAFSLVGWECVSNNCITTTEGGSLAVCGGPQSGTCVLGQGDRWTCECISPYAGRMCLECEEGARLMDGACVSERCIVQYPGDRPESVCGGEGQCVNDPTLGWSCVCNEGAVWRDFYCGPPTCLWRPDDVQFCNAHGMCFEGGCLCEEGHSGEHCEVEPIRCPTGEVLVDGACIDARCVFNGLICGGGGSCDVSGPVPVCVCDQGFELTEAGCTAFACLTTDEDGTHACTQHGACLPAGGSFSCVCDPVFRGPHCEACDSTVAVVIDGVCTSMACVSTDPLGAQAVCSNTGKCALSGGEYGCACPEGEAAIGGECVSETCLTDQGESCNHHGVCRFGVCQCEAGWAGSKCDNVLQDKCEDGFTYLDGACVSDVCMIDGTDCSGHGVCVRTGSRKGDWACDCIGAWTGSHCEISTMCESGKVFVDGECIPEACAFLSISNDGSLALCGGKNTHSACVQDGFQQYHCECDDSWLENDVYGCLPPACNVDGLSCPNGACLPSYDDFACECDIGFDSYEGRCVSVTCMEVSGFGTTVCSGLGQCVEKKPGVWDCECTGFAMGPHCGYCQVGSLLVGNTCVSEKCVTISATGDRAVCNRLGSCVQSGDDWACNCEAGSIPADGSCFPPPCFYPGDSNLCSGHGSCPQASCVCDPGYQGQHCEIPPPECAEGEVLVGYVCAPVECVADGLVCGGHGECVKTGSGHACSCAPGFVMTPQGCAALSCTTLVDGVAVVCGGNGKCVQGEEDCYICDCSPVSRGEHCEECTEAAILVDGVCVSTACARVLPTGDVSVCSGEGECQAISTSIGILGYSCSCAESDVVVDAQCVSALCLSNGRSPESCSSHGYCQFGVCHCDPYWTGELCGQKSSEPCEEGFTYINGACISSMCIQSNDVCHDRGICREVLPGTWKCYCEDGWAGQWCEMWA